MRSKIRTNDVAKICGVSPATVSRVINHRDQVKTSTIQRVETAMEKLGYDITSLQQQTVSNKVILMNCPQSDNPFYETIINGTQTSAEANGYHLLLYYNSINKNNILDFMSLLKTVNASGVILLSRLSTSILNEIRSKVPIIQCCEYNDEAQIPYVSIDDKLSAYNAVQFLINAGRNKIAFINGPKNYKYALERYAGYRQALEENHIFVPSSWITSVPKIDYQMSTTIIRQLLSREDKPNAIFAVSDTIAAAAINTARHMGIHIPDDIMVIGFDDTFVCQIVRPSITSVSQPRFQMGYTACEMLIEFLNEHYVNQQKVMLPTELIVRESALLNTLK